MKYILLITAMCVLFLNNVNSENNTDDHDEYRNTLGLCIVCDRFCREFLDANNNYTSSHEYFNSLIEKVNQIIKKSNISIEFDFKYLFFDKYYENEIKELDRFREDEFVFSRYSSLLWKTKGCKFTSFFSIIKKGAEISGKAVISNAPCYFKTFSFVHMEKYTDTLITFAHELGHNLGFQHDFEVDVTTFNNETNLEIMKTCDDSAFCNKYFCILNNNSKRIYRKARYSLCNKKYFDAMLANNKYSCIVRKKKVTNQDRDLHLDFNCNGECIKDIIKHTPYNIGEPKFTHEDDLQKRITTLFLRELHLIGQTMDLRKRTFEENVLEVRHYEEVVAQRKTHLQEHFSKLMTYRLPMYDRDYQAFRRHSFYGMYDDQYKRYLILKAKNDRLLVASKERKARLYGIEYNDFMRELNMYSHITDEMIQL